MADVSSLKLIKVHEVIEEITTFIERYLSLIDLHTTNFFTEDLWNRAVPSEMRNELLSLSNEKMTVLPSAPLFLNASHTDLVHLADEQQTRDVTRAVVDNLHSFVLNAYCNSLRH